MVFFSKRQIWWPTLSGWTIIVVLATGLGLIWVLRAEDYLRVTHRVSAKVLLVEGWIGADGVRAAGEEYLKGGYDYVVTAGGMTNNRWGETQWNYAEVAAERLHRMGIDPDHIVVARSQDTAAQRTYQLAVDAKVELDRIGVQIGSCNIFTMGVHSRRSRLIFSRVFGSDSSVGAIAWIPKDEAAGFWWSSSERSQDLLKESIAYPFELFLYSGRWLHKAGFGK